MPGLVENPNPNERYESMEHQKAGLEIAKLNLEIRDLKIKWIQLVTPVLSVAVGVLGLLLAAHIQNRQIKESADKFRAEQETAAERFRVEQQVAAERFREQQQTVNQQLLSSAEQAEKTRQQAEEHHQDEIFYKAIKDLDSRVPMERASAVTTLADFGVHSIKRKREVLRLFVLRLPQESDLTVLELLSQSVGRPALDVLVSKNRQLTEQLATATGRLLGIDSVRETINVTNVSGKPPTPDELMTVYFFKQLPLEITRTSLVWQDASASDIAFFQRPDRLKIQAAFRIAFEQIIKSPEATSKMEDAEDEFQSSIHDLWTSTQAIVGMLKSLSGNLDGVNLRRTVLIHPHLSGLDLRGIDARFAVWMGPIFRGSDLRFADLSDAEMKYADLHNANLVGANIARVHFGQQDNSLEERTLAPIRLLQNDAHLEGTNLWELAKCYLRDQQFDPAKLQEFKSRRQQILTTSLAKKYLSKIPHAIDN